jgi:hypothetical protein
VAGFCIEVKSGNEARHSLRLVDLGQCTASDSFQQGAVAAAWIHPKESRHWWVRRMAGELLLIEGAPDRLPRETESLLEWLPGRWGSFRGFEISLGSPQQPAQITAFVDPICTRPIFYRVSGRQLLIADKFATIALNTEDRCELNWDAVLEAMVLGSLYRYNLTSLSGAEELAPGEAIVFRGNQVAARYSNQMPEDAATSASAVRDDPEGTLARALEQSVRECWTDPKAALLLSGGLDSRAILALAGESRRAVTLEMSARETGIAKQIAETCGAKFIALPFPSDEWLRRAQEGFWIANAMRDTEFVNDIGLGARLSPYGIHGIAHGYLFDTILKGWLIRPLHQHVDLSLTVLGQMGPAGLHFRDTTSRASFHADKDVLGLLSKDGAQQAITHLRGTAESLTPATDGRFDITFERHILGWVSKQVHYGCYLSWMEAFDLSSPVFHPALWSWYRHSSAEDRYLGRAYRRALVGLQHPVFAIPDANTGAPISLPKERWTDTAQDRLWYRAARKIWRTVRRDRQAPYADKRSEKFRSPEGRQLMEFGIETLRANPLFDASALERALLGFSQGNDRPFEPLLTITGVAQWYDLVSRSKSLSAPQIREVSITHSFENRE